MANYYLIVGKDKASRSHKLCDCSDQLDVTKRQAEFVFLELRRRGKADRMVRVVETATRIVQYAVHAGNV